MSSTRRAGCHGHVWSVNFTTPTASRPPPRRAQPRLVWEASSLFAHWSLLRVIRTTRRRFEVEGHIGGGSPLDQLLRCASSWNVSGSGCSPDQGARPVRIGRSPDAEVSALPGSPQSSTSTVKGSVVVPADRITEAVPVNVACLLPGVAQVPGLLIDRASIDWAFIRTSAGWSLYSRFPVGRAAPHDEAESGLRRGLAGWEPEPAARAGPRTGRRRDPLDLAAAGHLPGSRRAADACAYRDAAR